MAAGATDKNKDGNKGKKEKKGAFFKIAIIFIVLMILCFCVWVVGFNALGLRDKYLTGIISQIPILRNVLPETGSETELEPDPESGYEQWTPEQLISHILYLEEELLEAENELKSVSSKSDGYVLEIASLQERLNELESYQESVRNNQNEFDNMIAKSDPKAYESFYASINPVNAERLYQEVVLQNINSQQLKDYVAAFNVMDESAAAAILEELMTTDSELTVLVLKNLSNAKRGAILAEFSAENAARIVRIMAQDIIE